jgi:multisubunit Na+/H+ antiporter MnhF subunit
VSKNVKNTYVSLLGLIGLIALLVGLFTNVYNFTIGLIIAIVLWVGSGILARYWGVKKEKS